MNDDKVVHFKSIIYQELVESRGSWSTSALRTFLYIFKDYISDNNIENEVWIKIYKSFLKDFAGLHQEYNFVLEKIDKII